MHFGVNFIFPTILSASWSKFTPFPISPELLKTNFGFLANLSAIQSEKAPKTSCCCCVLLLLTLSRGNNTKIYTQKRQEEEGKMQKIIRKQNNKRSREEADGLNGRKNEKVVFHSRFLVAVFHSLPFAFIRSHKIFFFSILLFFLRSFSCFSLLFCKESEKIFAAVVVGPKIERKMSEKCEHGERETLGMALDERILGFLWKFRGFLRAIGLLTPKITRNLEVAGPNCLFKQIQRNSGHSASSF